MATGAGAPGDFESCENRTRNFSIPTFLKFLKGRAFRGSIHLSWLFCHIRVLYSNYIVRYPSRQSFNSRFPTCIYFYNFWISLAVTSIRQLSSVFNFERGNFRKSTNCNFLSCVCIILILFYIRSLSCRFYYFDCTKR